MENRPGTFAIETPAMEILKTRPHFEALDGLRGIAALAVVTFHFMEMVTSDYSKNFIGHGFLAVDFFFCLSGFVIGYAYDDRVGKMGIVEFLKSRLIRLHPLVVLGSVLGLLSFYFDPFAHPPAAYHAGRVLLIFLTSAFLIPFPVMKERYLNNFGFNAPAWSLFWEYIANIVYAVVLYRLRRWWLMVFAAVAAVFLFNCGYREHWVGGGWSGPTFWDGGIRVAFSFTAGLIVFRSNWRIRNRLGFLVLAVLLLAALMMPYLKMLWLQESLLVTLYFPLLIALGAGVTLTKRSEAFCVFAGKISYPLYMTHYAFIWIFGNYYSTYKPTNLHLAGILIVSISLLIGFAYLAMVLYDVPLRRWLTSKRRAALLTHA